MGAIPMLGDEKSRLLQTLTDAEALNKSIQEEAQRLVAAGQSGRDHAGALKQFVNSVPMSPQQVRGLTTDWQNHNDHARTTLHGLREVGLTFQSSGYSVMAGTSTATTQSFSFDIATDVGGVPNRTPIPPEATRAAQHLVALAQREDVQTKVVAAVTRCELHRTGAGHRSTLDLLNESREALEQPSSVETAPTAALIRLREAIDRAVTDLLSRCKGQEPAQGWKRKVVSIGRRCNTAAAQPEHFERVAEAIATEIDLLSGAKERPMQRDQVVLAYYDGLKVLLALLELIDESRLRN